MNDIKCFLIIGVYWYKKKIIYIKDGKCLNVIRDGREDI